MTLTIEVANESGGASSTKRTFLLSEDYTSPEEMEAAAIQFIRTASAANEQLLGSYRSAVGENEVPVW